MSGFHRRYYSLFLGVKQQHTVGNPVLYPLTNSIGLTIKDAEI